MAPYVSLTAQRELELPLPPLDTQRSIGAITRALDDKIDSNRRLGKMLEETAATVFHGRFVNFIGLDELRSGGRQSSPKAWSRLPIRELWAPPEY